MICEVAVIETPISSGWSAMIEGRKRSRNSLMYGFCCSSRMTFIKSLDE